MIILTFSMSLAVLLVSNLWLLREVERLRRLVEAHQDELLALDAQICRLMAQVSLLVEPPDLDDLEENGQNPAVPAAQDDRPGP